MEKFFNYYSREIPVDKVLLLTEEILVNINASFSEIEGCNVFFHLQNEYFYLKSQGLIKEAAYICYLISYYLFHLLTPPHSDKLAYEYAQKAIKLDPTSKYADWLEEVKKGN